MTKEQYELLEQFGLGNIVPDTMSAHDIYRLYDHIQARDDAPEGIIRERVPLQEACAEMAGGDMVMCRVNKELVPVAYQLLRRGIKAIIRGKDVSDQILTMIRKFKADDVAELLNKVTVYLNKESVKLVALGRRGESRLDALNDKCETLIELCDGITTIDELTKRIETLFQEFTPEGKPNNAVLLGTIHGCKGLEQNRVYILAPELMPHPRATSEREYEQELHLCWVAATRAKFDAEHPGELVFVKGRDKLSTGAIPAVYNWNYERADALKHTPECRDAWYTRGAACICGAAAVEADKPLSLQELTAAEAAEGIYAAVYCDGDSLTEPAPFAPIDEEPPPSMPHLAQVDAESDTEDNYRAEMFQ